MFSGELANKLTWIKRRLQLGRRAQLRRRVHHHQCRPRQCSRQGPATGGRDEQDDTSCVTLQDRRRFFHFFHLKLETDGQGDHGRSTLIPVLQEAEFSRRGPQRPRPRWGNSWEVRRLWPEPSQNQEMCTLHNKEARPSSSNEGPKSPPSRAGRRGGMPPGRVAPNGGTRSQGGAVQIGSERAWQRRAGCERADCDTNNAASIKEARVDHIEGGACVTSIQGGVQWRNLVSATI